MHIEKLDIQTRAQIHNFTKTIIRKYYKGLKTGKLSLSKFVDNILKSNNPPNWLLDNNSLKDDSDFKISYAEYIQNIIYKYKENENINKYKFTYTPKVYLNNYINLKPKKASSKQQLFLNETILKKGYTLTIPSQYLTETEVEWIINYIDTGNLPIGQERIYNYIKKG